MNLDQKIQELFKTEVRVAAVKKNEQTEFPTEHLYFVTCEAMNEGHILSIVIEVGREFCPEELTD